MQPIFFLTSLLYSISSIFFLWSLVYIVTGNAVDRCPKWQPLRAGAYANASPMSEMHIYAMGDSPMHLKWRNSLTQEMKIVQC